MVSHRLQSSAGDTMVMSSRCSWDHSSAMLGSSATQGVERQTPWMATLAWFHSLASCCLQNAACMPGSHVGVPAPLDQLHSPTKGTKSRGRAEQDCLQCCSIICASCGPHTNDTKHFKLVSCTRLCGTSQHNQNQSIIITTKVSTVQPR